MPVRNSLLTPEDELVGDKVAAEILGISNPRTLSNWRTNGQHPDLAYIRIGRAIRYRVGDLLDFRKRHTVGGVNVVEPVIEHAAPAVSTQAKATPTINKVPSACASSTFVGSMESPHGLSTTNASRNVYRPSDLARKHLTFNY